MPANISVLYNRDLLDIVRKRLTYDEFRRLALVNRGMCNAIRKSYPLFANEVIEIIDSLRLVDPLKDTDPPIASRLRKAHAFFYFARDNSKTVFKSVRSNFTDLISRYLYVFNIRHPYSGMNQNLKPELIYIAKEMGLRVPKPTTRQNLWALYTGYRLNPKLSMMYYGASALALLGIDIYTMVMAGQYGDGYLMQSNCLNTIITTANIGDPDSEYIFFSNLIGTYAPFIMFSTMIGSSIASTAFPFRRALNNRATIFVTEQNLNLLPSFSAPQENELCDFLANYCAEIKGHFAPSSLGIVWQARKLRNYLVYSRIISDDIELGRDRISRSLLTKTQQLVNMMGAYKWSPCYRLLNGESIRNTLLKIPGIEDKPSSAIRKILIALYSDPLRYVLSAAFYYGCYLTLMSPMFSTLKSNLMAHSTNHSISYSEYMTNYVSQQNCCIIDNQTSRQVCPSLSSYFSNFNFILANTTMYKQTFMETRIYNLPVIIILFGVFYFILG